MNLSLQNRVMLSAAIVLLVFLGLTGWVLDRAFRDSAESALQGRLEGQLFGLLGVAEYEPGKGLVIDSDPPEARFSRPGSGLVAQIVDDEETPVWQSQSAIGLPLPPLGPLGVDVSMFQRVSIDGHDWFSYEYGLSWIDSADEEHAYTLRIAEHPDAFTAVVSAFRQTMITWFAVVAVMLLIVQSAILRWGLSPLRRIEQELAEVERGSKERLGEDYPRELQGLAGNLNLLIGNERRHLERYRNTLADLAHSLKTPLAVLRSSVGASTSAEDMQAVVEEQVQGMTEQVEYQLQKAAASGTTSLAQGLDVVPYVDRLVASLTKVYHDKAIKFDLELAGGASFYGESGDLMEVLGNLLDNACKWCKNRVRLHAFPLIADQWREGITIRVEDDGPGIAADDIDDVLQRGRRADSMTPGHGIGLAVVSDIVAAYGGTVEIDKSKLGGAKITLIINYKL